MAVSDMRALKLECDHVGYPTIGVYEDSDGLYHAYFYSQNSGAKKSEAGAMRWLRDKIGFSVGYTEKDMKRELAKRSKRAAK